MKNKKIKQNKNLFSSNKKAVNLSLQTVVVALILLVVMAVVLIIFGKGMGQQDEIITRGISDIGNCFPGSPNQEGCEDKYIKTCPDNQILNSEGKCENIE